MFAKVSILWREFTNIPGIWSLMSALLFNVCGALLGTLCEDAGLFGPAILSYLLALVASGICMWMVAYKIWRVRGWHGVTPGQERMAFGFACGAALFLSGGAIFLLCCLSYQLHLLWQKGIDVGIGQFFQ